MSGFDIGGVPGMPDLPGLSGLPDVSPQRLLGDAAEGVGAAGVQETPGAGDGESRSFGSVLGDAIEEVHRLGSETADKAEAIARGEPVEIHELMVAMGKSDVAFNLMLEVRNKMVEAWQQLTRSVI